MQSIYRGSLWRGRWCQPGSCSPVNPLRDKNNNWQIVLIFKNKLTTANNYKLFSIVVYSVRSNFYIVDLLLYIAIYLLYIKQTFTLITRLCIWC